MATGDQADFIARITRELPKRWFGDDSPVLGGALAAFASVGATCYAMVQFARAQMRLGTMSGGWLDLFALDYFGIAFPRGSKSDDQFRSSIASELLRERVTRAGIAEALEDITGTPPRIVELWNANDCGAYDGVGLAYAGEDYAPAPAAGYDQLAAYDSGVTSYDPQSGASGTSSPGMGMWGSLELPFQLFITAYRPGGGGVANADGVDVSGGYDLGLGLRYVGDDEEAAAPISDDEILATVARNQAAGIVAWTAIENAPAA